MCLNGIDILKNTNFGLNYVHKSPNYLDQHVQKKDINPTEWIEFIDRAQFLKSSSSL